MAAPAAAVDCLSRSNFVGIAAASRRAAPASGDTVPLARRARWIDAADGFAGWNGRERMEDWRVQPHGPLERLSARVCRVEGTIEKNPLRRVMTVAKTASGKLVVHSPVALDAEGMKELDAFGPVGWIIVPNAFHRIDAPRFAKRYPNAKVLCPPAARKKVEKVVRVDGTFEDFPEDTHVRFEVLASTGGNEGVMIVSEEGQATLVVNDVLFNMPDLSGFPGFVLKHVTKSSGGPCVSRIARWFLVQDKAQLKADLERLAGIPDLARVVVSHHEVVTERPAEVLRNVAATL